MDEASYSVKVFFKTIITSVEKENKVKKEKRPKKQALKVEKDKTKEDVHQKFTQDKTIKQGEKDANRGEVINHKTAVYQEKPEQADRNKIGEETNPIIDEEDMEKTDVENDIENKKDDNKKNTDNKKSAEKDKNKKNKEKSNTKIKKKSEKKSEKKSKKEDKKKESNFKDIKDIFEKVKAFLNNDKYNGVILFLFKKLLKVIKSILPTKVRLNAIIGTGDPATTGYAVGSISILYAVMDHHIKVTPDFNDKVFKGDFYVKGRIFLCIIALNGVKIILDKRVRRLMAEYIK
jgi:hypothetical protein